MKGIILDASADSLTVIAVSDDDTAIYNGQPGAKRHTGEILVRTEEMLNRIGLKANDLDAVGVVTGPGSFTGIRIGVSTALALIRVSGAKPVSITSLESALFGLDNAAAFLDCKNGNYYALKRENGTETYFETDVDKIKEIELNKIFINGADAEGLLKVFRQKYANGDFGSPKPFYMKLSSAERVIKKC